ncbi:MAG: SusC/RagA family TonB-linked outer membrane protein, partial [Flavobacteriaceae bacterium]|nr:SusC/RagA family TonB-linked outer membrane protein [Flavobacteriaceae bacterium]
MKQNNANRNRLLLLLLIFPSLVFAQVTLTGVVNGERGDTVPFVNVIEKGTTNGTTTGMEGSFTIEVASLPTVLVFSSLGYETLEFRAIDRTPIDVTLGESAQALEEVVVTGLATSV